MTRPTLHLWRYYSVFMHYLWTTGKHSARHIFHWFNDSHKLSLKILNKSQIKCALPCVGVWQAQVLFAWSSWRCVKRINYGQSQNRHHRNQRQWPVNVFRTIPKKSCKSLQYECIGWNIWQRPHFCHRSETSLCRCALERLRMAEGRESRDAVRSAVAYWWSSKN